MPRKSQKLDINTQNDASFQYNDPFRILSAIERVDNAIQITSDVNVVLDNIVTEVFHIFQSDRAWLFYPCNPKVPSFDVSFESTNPLYPGAKSLQQKVPMTKDMADYCHRALSHIGEPEIDPREGSALTNDIAIQFNAKSLMFMALQPQIGDAWMFGLHQCDHKRIWTDDDKRLFKIIGNRITNCIGNMLYLNRLKESELKFRSITEQTSDLISLTDEDGKITYASPSSKKLFGFEPHEMLGHHFTEYLVESEIPAAASAFREAIIKGASTKSMELLMKRKNGSLFQGELAGSLFDSPNMRGTLVVIRDITDRKSVEQVLRESEKRFRDLADLLPEAVFEADMDMNLTFVNQKAYELTGYTKEDFENGLNGLDMFVPEQRSRARENILKHIQGQNAGANEYLGIKKDGSTFPVLLNTSRIVFRGKNIGFRGIFIDLTERNQIQQQLQQKQKMESIGSLAGGIAHDFNNILFPIIGMAELLMEDLPEGSLERENADEIFRAGKRGRDLVKQILTFSRQSDHPMAPTAFQNVMKEVLKLTRATIPSNIDMRHDIQPDCGLILANPTQLHQVAMNIMTNAYHAAENEGGRISVELYEKVLKASDLADTKLKPGKYLVLSISDTGAGMPNDILDKIFDPYFTTKERGKGTGLGLAVAYGIIKEHKGEITVQSELGKGSTFKIYLPLMKKSNINELISAGDDLKTGDERILLVDDEAPIAKLEQQILERLGYKVTKCENSLEALKTFKANPNIFDLVISDMTMPRMTGDRLAQKLMDIRADIPVIICTGFSERINREKAAAMGIKGYLMKPIEKSEMAKRVRDVLDSAGNPGMLNATHRNSEKSGKNCSTATGTGKPGA